MNNGEMQRLWQEMQHAHRTFMDALRQFLSGDKSMRLKLIEEGYKTDRYLTTTVLEYVPIEELKELLPLLLSHACSVHAYLDRVRQIILRLPKDWLVEHIEAASESFLESGTDEEYRRFLELYFMLDPILTARLAHRAAAASDPDIREAGQDFLEKLKVSSTKHT